MFADFLAGLGWARADLGGTVEMPRKEQIAALCDGKVAAIAITVPHPNGFVRDAMATCHATLLDLAGPGVDGAVAAHPAYAPARLDMGVYGVPGMTIQSFGPHIVLVATAKLDDGTVSRLLAGIFKHMEEFKKAHPALAALDAGTVASSGGLGAERHQAATRYLNENKIGDMPAAE
jgi:TRAP transporter TAXI family solute receptor